VAEADARAAGREEDSAGSQAGEGAVDKMVMVCIGRSERFAAEELEEILDEADAATAAATTLEKLIGEEEFANGEETALNPEEFGVATPM
jgi:hypothetical protein